MASPMMVNGNGTVRYALPPQMAQGNMATRTANAKQIKRRTKTGCLTCRKRRIKVSLERFRRCPQLSFADCVSGWWKRWFAGAIRLLGRPATERFQAKRLSKASETLSATFVDFILIVTAQWLTFGVFLLL